MQSSFIKKLTALMTCFALLATIALTGCGDGGTTVGDHEQYSFWLITGDDSSYYDDYAKNPVIEYLTQQTWGPDNKKVGLEFIIPVAGAEGENFNTLLTTGDYPDVMDATLYSYSGSFVDLYEQGIILDLTEYIDQYMPNYKAYLDSHPAEAQQAVHIVNGEKKYLALRNFSDAPGYMWGGYMYRRDWIIKYGQNPVDGSAFSGAYTGTLADGSVDKTSWEDNVVFPSGETDPVYISDWEWMMEIFARAITDQNITDGYVTSLYYPGYLATGDLVCAFGGGTSGFYKNKEEQIVFGGTDDDFQVYLQAMNTWYENGWIDKAFTEHAADMFFSIDNAKVRSGKVGIWYGLNSQLEGNMDDGEALTAGIVVFAARQPINDIYGMAAQQNVEPYNMYQTSPVGNSWILTDKLKDKDIVPLLTLMDYMFSAEGSLMGTMGLNKEQYELTKNELYTRFNLTEGAYSRIPDNEVKGTKIYKWVDTIALDGGGLAGAIKANCFFSLNTASLFQPYGADSLISNYDQWTWYKDTGSINTSITNQLTPDEQKTVAKIQNNINEFMAKSVPPFIKGDKDPFNAADWEAFVKALSKYSPEKVTVIYQEKLDNLN